MSLHELADILDEIERCKKLYPESNQDQGILKLLYQLKNQFESEYSSIKNTWVQCFTQEQANKNFKNNQILLSETSINKDTYLEFLELILTNFINYLPELKVPLEGLSAFVREDLKSFEDTIDTEKICETINESFTELNIQKDFTTFVFSFIISFLYQWHLDESINKISTNLWTHGNCPVCGKKPHFGMLRKEDGAKVMECWQCAARWVYSRLKCPYCGATDHNKLGYFTAGSNNICRIYFCNECKKYYKIFDFREREHDHVILPIHHIATLTHDILAVKEGYTSGSYLQWVNDEELNQNKRGSKISDEIN